MKIKDILKKKQTVSFEVFPPKPEQDHDLSGISQTLLDLTCAKPDFVSVTYGAGGENRPRALDIAEIVLAKGMLPLSHLTAVGYTKEHTRDVLASLHKRGVSNILALRGDIPKNAHFPNGPWKDFRYATDLVRFIRENNDFCLGGAAYPEGHTESISIESDIPHMQMKIQLGTEFFITQLFFDNQKYRDYRERLAANGITTPIIAGIMPVFQAKQINRIIEISGCSVPKKLQKILDRYGDSPDSMLDAGSDYAAEQIVDLWDLGISGIHLYTMNKSDQVLEIVRRAGLMNHAEKEKAGN